MPIYHLTHTLDMNKLTTKSEKNFVWLFFYFAHCCVWFKDIFYTSDKFLATDMQTCYSPEQQPKPKSQCTV